MSNDIKFQSTLLENIKGVICTLSCPIIRVGCSFGRTLVRHGVLQEDKRFENLKLFKDKHRGERVFIVATGPSLTLEDLDKLKDEITISMNSIVNIFDETTFRPTYYLISDLNVYNRVNHAQTIIPPGRVFVGIGNVNTSWNISLKDVKNEEDKNINLFRVDRTITLPYLYRNKSAFKTDFSFDSYERVIDGGITYCAIQLAVYMGFKEIYLIGTDCNYLDKIAHFCENNSSGMNEQEAIFAAYQQECAYKCALANMNNSSFTIYNATRGGKLEVFKRVNFDGLF